MLKQNAGLVAQIKGQIEEGRRKGFDFGAQSFFTRILKGRLASLGRTDAALADDLYAEAFGKKA
jgi:hypothetical protein